MTIFDLLFLVASLGLLVALCRAALAAVRDRRDRALAILRRTGMVVVGYFMAIVAVSAATPARVVPRGVPQCFDDWCIAVTRVDNVVTESTDSMHVTLQLSSRARGISQGERDVYVYVSDDRGRRYAPISEIGALPLSMTLPPQGVAQTRRLFPLPADAQHPVLIVAHDRFPHCCIIGDRESLLHRRTVVPLN